MDRAEAEGIWEAGRERCVEVILELAGAVEQLRSRGERLEERVGCLEEQSRRDSRNSSSPPSQDPPKTRAERRAQARKKAKAWSKREGEKREQGAQPGHEGSGRKLLGEDQMQEIHHHYPQACGGCGREFSEQEKRPAERFGRHQVAELPPISVIYFEHRTHHLPCPGCGKRTAGRLPVGVTGSPFGMGVHAAVVTLTARIRVSRRDMPELARELFGLGLSVGTVDAICQRACVALEGPHQALAAKVLSSPVLNIDETGWYTAHEQRTMWTASTPEAAIFRICSDRHRDRLEELIGKDFSGIVGSDRWWAYELFDPEQRQACWEHLKRDFFKHSEGLAEQKEFGTAGLALTKRLFKTWHAFEEHQDRARLITEIAAIKAELQTLLEHAARKSPRTKYHRRFANNLLKIWPALWTFVTIEGVQPTNNAAERSLRGPVIYRKLSHGTQSEKGEQFIERALSVSVTCRLQARSMFTYMHGLLTAHARGDPLPTLA
ncbi:MAG: IS66 family transposase [Solirubrobacteraceae bacterium]